MPLIHYLLRDPFERYPTSDYFMSFYAHFWRSVFVQQQIAALAQTAVEFPPMQEGASFNLDAVKSQTETSINAHCGLVIKFCKQAIKY